MSGEIPRAVLVEIFRHAREVFPAECCGWLTGPRGGTPDSVRRCRNAQVDGDHPTAADRGAETAYVIAGDDLIALNRGLSTDTPPLVLYHSHPNGRAYFSSTDQAVATDPWGEGPMYPVDQLVVGLDGERVVEAALFRWDDGAGKFVEIARFEGEAI
jgi:[CysO sulfur-carrier protein]-S-L-cysteine hydrolase